MIAVGHMACQVTINEFVASNSLGTEDSEFSNNSDWMELYNAGVNEVNLSGWYFTDNLNDSTKWTFPVESTIAPGGFLLVWCDGEDTGLHTSFKLSRTGEELGLYTPDLILQDSRSFRGAKH